MYPYRIRVKDPALERILDLLAENRTVTICDNKEYIRKLGYKFKPIRKNIFIGFDHKTMDSNISLKNPSIKIEKQGRDYIFKIPD